MQFICQTVKNNNKKLLHMFALTSLVICRIAKNFGRKLHTIIRPKNVFMVAFTE